MTQPENPIKFLIFILLAFGIGVLMGGMYTKVRFLEAGYGTPGSQVLAEDTQGAPLPTPSPAPAPAAPPKSTTVSVEVTPDDPVLGKSNAKLTIVEFGDYQCPFCGRFFKEVQPSILKDYVDTGKVKFVYKNLAFLGKESTDAANAALCAKEQNKFWEYHAKLYNSQDGENQGTFSLDNLKKFAASLGLNAAKFDSCLDLQKYNSQVQSDLAEANKNGFTGTPSTAVGTVSVIGAQPYNEFKTIIDAELGK